MIEAIVINRLIEWAKWKMNTGVALGYKSQVSYVRLSGGNTLTYDTGYDADCLLTDRAVNLLPEVYKLVIRMEYIDAIPSEIQRVHCYGKSRRTYRDDRTEAYKLLGNLIDTLIDVRQRETA
ncbi:hypothetical protein SAMN05216428_10196 [Nitrosospira sp. Nsp11]|uniref:hypothetical protein n=1 Tax=Nitrosospira sp. Nsp11 TaxID=1855338 RepID=UPI00090F4013|nr:hypothetical protein [Nitrosospira sp. Nsp11]SHL10780.1 hypothetical protein SAMN05216428_10196 [Nitrosospira sp. Nsp11]